MRLSKLKSCLVTMSVKHCCCRQVASVVSDSVRPHRRQPTRLPRPRGSPGRNTGVGCHFLLQCRKVKSESEVAQSCLTLSDPMVCSLPGSSIHGIFQARVLEWGAIALSEYQHDMTANVLLMTWLDHLVHVLFFRFLFCKVTPSHLTILYYLEESHYVNPISKE